MDKNQKKEFVAEIQEKINESSCIVLTHYHGLSVEDITVLRKEMRDNGAVLKVAKNRLVKIALANLNISGLDEFLTGPIAMVIANDPVSVAKSLVKYAKSNESFKIMCAMVDNKVIDREAVVTLSKMMSLDELRAKIIGIISAPARDIVGMLQAPSSQLVRVFDAYSAKN